EIFYQPSELLKILLVAFLASYLGDYQQVFRRRSFLPWRYFGPITVMWGGCVVLLVGQRDLGAASICFLVFLLMLYVASGSTLLLIGGGIAMLLAGVVAYQVFGVVAQRITIWLDPWTRTSSDSFQIVQSLMAINAGGILGEGIGQGVPTSVPVVHTDFAYAA